MESKASHGVPGLPLMRLLGETPSTPPPPETPPDCVSSPFGCCADARTAAHGEHGEGCCLSAEFGCCPDNLGVAAGPAFQGCGCEFSMYGCCPDKETVAQGPAHEGCGCQYTAHGCCPDKETPAGSPDQEEGCPCHSFPFGCCPDGVGIARGPTGQGCSCQHSLHGCCPDGATPASGPGAGGCGCKASQFGCCPDGVTEASGKFLQGCEEAPGELRIPGEACGLPKERGPCVNFTIKWFFDVEFGDCSRFWYGGCEGNLNRFGSREECAATCVDPEGEDACHLPRATGPCTNSKPSWYHDTSVGACRPFRYSGCLGNSNRFADKQTCEEQCVRTGQAAHCFLPQDSGPCADYQARWSYESTSGVCKQFLYGGCHGNENRFVSRASCERRCGTAVGQWPPPAARLRFSWDPCELPLIVGPCSGSFRQYFYDRESDECFEFSYGGCGGNKNRFDSLRLCQQRCQKRGSPTPTSAPTEGVEGVSVRPSCTDNPFFANCKTIVQGRYCTNEYYSKFCCRTCTLAGQLPFAGAPLESGKKQIGR
ncbi:papilin-like [Penaeus indicus]|uniref:papilin-like n=1 Tax=Penaeus indicus TaxID=29960 RepID=UPI00300D8B1C